MLRKTPLKRTPFKRKERKPKPTLAELKQKGLVTTADKVRSSLKKRKPTGEKDLFLSIWEERPHRCEVCHVPISEPSPSNFSHLLPKGTYPDFRLDRRNVVIKCVQCHDQWHQMHTKLLYSPYWAWVVDRYNTLKAEAYS